MCYENEDLENKIKAYLARFLDNEECLSWPIDLPLNEMLDSIELFMFLIGLDKEFNRSIPDERFNLKEMNTLKSIAIVLKEIPPNGHENLSNLNTELG